MSAKRELGRVLYLRPPSAWPKVSGPIGWSLRSEEGVFEGTCDSLSRLPVKAKGAEVRLWSPAAATQLLETKLPPMSRARAAKALPYSVEERLIDDPSALHFARAEQPDGRIVVGVTSVKTLSSWLEALHAADLEAAAVCPIVLSLPLKEGAWSLEPGGEYLLVRTSLLAGRAIRWSAEPPRLLNSLLHEARASGRAPKRLLVWKAPPGFDYERWTSVLGLDVKAGTADECGEAAPPLNLLQGAFAPSWELPALAARLAPAAIMLALWAAGGVGASVYRWRRLARAERAQSKEMAVLFHRSFPEERAGPDPAGQLARQLSGLRARGGRLSSGDLLPLLDKLARGLAALPGVQLRAIEYGDAAITATVFTSDLAAIEQLKQSCAGNGLNLEITSATQTDGKTQSRLRLSEGDRHASL